MKLKLTTLLFFTWFNFTYGQAPVFQWAHSFGDSQQDAGRSVVTDKSGNVLTAGDYSGIIDFDPGPSSYTLNSMNGSMFISKLDPSGNFIWAKSFGDSALLSMKSLAIDTLNNVYAIGSFSNTIDFDPGPGTYTLTSGGNLDTYILKLDT